jgi:hypothetical protein
MFYICALASNIKIFINLGSTEYEKPQVFILDRNWSYTYWAHLAIYPIDSQDPGEPRPWLLCPYTPSIPDYSALSRKLYKQCLLSDDTSHLRATGKDRYKGTSG